MKIDFNVNCMFPRAKLFDFVPMGNDVIKSRKSDDLSIAEVMRDAVDVLVANGVDRKHINASTIDAYETPCINLYITDNINVDKLATCLSLTKPTCNNTLKTLNLSDVYNVISFRSSREIE